MKQISRGLIRSLSILALAKAMFVTATKMETDDKLTRDGTIDKGEYDLRDLELIQAYRKKFVDSLHDFMGLIYKGSMQKDEVEGVTSRTTDYAMSILKDKTIDLDFVGIFLLKKLVKQPKIDKRIIELIDLEKIDKLSKMIDDTYQKNITFKIKNRVNHIALINSIFLKVFK